MKEMPFTGERYVPTEHGRIAYEHYHRYAACLQAAAGKTVLDIACGEGFGSALLAGRAAKVIGVDIDAATVRHAVKKYSKVKNATFLVGDGRAIPLDKNSVDLIVSFETIEHIREHEQLLKEFLRVLRPNGAIIVSSPDRESYSEKPGYTNPYHVHELTHEQFIRLFREKFRFVRVYRQRLAIASFVIADEAKGPKLLHSFMAGKHGTEPGSRPLRGSLYSLVFCSNNKGSFRSLGSSIHLDPEDDLYLEQERVLRWASGLHEEHEVLKQQIQASNGDLEEAKKNSAAVNEAIRTAAKTIAELAQRNADIETQCRELGSALSQRSTQSERLQAEMSQLTAESERLQTELSQRSAESGRLQTELSQRRAESKRLQTELSQQNAENERLQTELSQRSAENERLQTELSQQGEESERLQTELLQQRAENERLRTELSLQAAGSQLLQTVLSQQSAESQRLQTELLSRRAEIDGIQGLLSWRLTIPMRTIETKFHIIRTAKSAAKLIWWTMNFHIYRRLRQRRRFARETTLIQSAGLFDQDWYLAQYPDVAQSGVNPLVHYVSYGAAEGRDPNPLFDTDWYLAQYPDVAQSGVNPLGHYLRYGATEGRAPNRYIDTDLYLPEGPDLTQSGVNPPGHPFPDGVSAKPTDNIFQAELLSARGPVTRDLAFALADRPAVSIIIPVYGKIDYTIQCLCSLENQKSKYSFEVIVVDDCSPDDTRHRLAAIKNIVVVANQTNLGFIRSCNVGAAAARGEYIVFLNNDTIVLNGWLDALIDTFAMHPSAGLVGSKLIYPDGRLQEAGGIIWDDASGWNVGRLDDPSKPEYNYVREVDYCSGASIALRRSLFDQLGHLDERYVPAYFDDVDLAFAVSDIGLKVLYQPASRVVHYEGVTSGTDLSSGVKTYQLVNQKKFAEKWAERLVTHNPSGEKWRLARDRLACTRILVIDAATPTPDQDAGSVRAYYFLKILVELGHKVTFVAENLQRMGHYTENIQQLGIECIYFPYYSSHKAYLEKYGDEFDIVILFRAWTAEKFFNIVKKYCPTAKIVFETVDLHYLREERHAELSKSPKLRLQAARTKEVEIGLMRKVDETILVSDTEIELLKREDPKLSLRKIPLVMETFGSRTPFSQRRDLVFVGGYQHTPNVDAMEFFVAEVWPLLKDRLPYARLLILGSKMPEKIRELQRYERVVPIGFVPDIGEYLDRCRLTVAPLRFGAGIKGKIASSGAFGVPTVATTIAAEGMGLQDGYNILIADTPDVFADQIFRLYSNEDLWNKLSKNILDFVEENYSLAVGKRLISDLLMKLGH